jgi:hypothetical protein
MGEIVDVSNMTSSGHTALSKGITEQTWDKGTAKVGLAGGSVETDTAPGPHGI